MIKMNEDGFPDGADKCPACEKFAVVRVDGVNTCLNCGGLAYAVTLAVHKVLHRGGNSKRDHIAQGRDITQRQHDG